MTSIIVTLCQIAVYSADVADMDDDMYPATGRLHRHGISCAGVLAMAKDKTFVGWVWLITENWLLSGSHHSDATEAIALGLDSQHIDIYSNS